MVADSPAGEVTARKAVRFFWFWLIAATAVSVAGNVAHAVLSAPVGRLQLAAAAAVVPPAVLLGATHSVALLVRTRRVGFSYWCALAMTVALAGCAFVLSFDALRELASALGMPQDRAWLWPVAIDVSIANSTVSLLSLTPPPAQRDNAIGDVASPPVGTASGAMVAPGRVRGAQSGLSASGGEGEVGSAWSGVAAMPPPRSPGRVTTRQAPVVDAPAQQQWRPAADELIRCGVTSKDPAVVAAVLAEHAAGTAPSTISRRHKVHHSTVGRILAGAAELGG